MKAILGTKEYMTQMFDDAGNAYPVTVLAVPGSVVTQVKTKAKEGYSAVQLGYGARKPSRTAKAQVGHLKAAKEQNPDMQNPRYLREFKVAEAELGEFTVGSWISPDAFAVGDKVQIVGTSKSKGFQGVIKRHGFKGGPRSHGQKHSERAPGSIGATGVQRVFKGMRMGGRMGGERVTQKGLKVLRVDLEAKEMYVKGAVQGRRGTLLEISKK